MRRDVGGENEDFKDGLDFNDWGNRFSFVDKRIIARGEEVKTFFGKDWDGPWELRRKKGFYSRNGRLKKLALFILEGRSLKETSSLSGYSRGVITAFKKRLEAFLGRQIKCACGKPSMHGRFCAKTITKCANSRCLGFKHKNNLNRGCSGKKFGIKGDICRACYHRLYSKQKRKEETWDF